MYKIRIFVVIGVLGVVGLVVGTASNRTHRWAPAAAASLRPQIESIYERSVRECAVFRAGDQDCIKTQFADNYRWEVIKDHSAVGAPGVPGPLPVKIWSTALDANSAKNGW